MNVTNRRKSTDADTTPTIQTSHHHNSQQTPQNQHHQPHLSYVSCRQAAIASSRNHHNHSSRQGVLVVNAEEEEQEPIVTSTSADCLLPLQAEGEGEEVNIDLNAGAVTSPARITSSTNNNALLNYSSIDSLYVEEEMVMPTTSENANRTERRDETSASSLRLKLRSALGSNGTTVKDMVARDTTHTTVADAATAATGVRDGGGVGGGSVGVLNDQAASTSNNSDGHKIILKLPKASVSACESNLNVDNNEDDLRKVEPLKINLHNTHHHHNAHHTPKITIKPILKEPVTDASLVSSEECSSSAEDDIVSRITISEPHIVPRLTIRSKNEDYGSSHTTVVPKLTIKINDTSTSTDGVGKTNAALNTPPLPKLTIKTGQDGQTESIISNVSPASSTHSSSSSSASTYLSSANSVLATPKVIIKPLHKTQDFTEHQQPLIPKLCIKTNTLSTDSQAEEATASKIPKLTIKTGQEHAVIITQHNDHAKNSGGIPKMTIKTNTIVESSALDKIPRLTIKTTTNPPESIPKLCINKAQREASLASSGPCLSPKQPVVPKLTISRQAVQTERTVVDPVEMSTNATSIPKMTIKTQSYKPPECVPKPSVKSSTKQRRKTDDIPEDPTKPMELNKTVPKLTIKNVGSPKQKLKIVKDDEINRKASPSPIQPNSICDDTDYASLNEINDVNEFRDLSNVDNAGGESSNSQEFRGFNESEFVEKKSVVEEYRRHSDDMDIDESLHNQHEPQIFQNASHFVNQLSLRDDTSCTNDRELNGQAALSACSEMAVKIIDTVDLTSSAGSSPIVNRFEYNEDDDDDEEEAAAAQQVLPQETHQTKADEPINQTVPNTNILLERLQRETSVIRNTQTVIANHESNLLPLPPLHPKPQSGFNNSACTTSRYPQLMERLMTNGATANMNINTVEYSHMSKTIESREENIIDSIEILDTPEGSPRGSLDERPQQVNAVHEKLPPSIPNGLHYPKELLEALNNNNFNLKRHAPPQMINNSLGGMMGQSENNLDELPSKLRKLQNDILAAAKTHNDLNIKQTKESSSVDAINSFKSAAGGIVQSPASNHQRSRKQKHEHLLQLPSDEAVIDAMQANSLDSLQHLTDMYINASESNTLVNKRKSGRPKKKSETVATPNAKDETADSKSRRVQLLRKRLAIDMVAAEQPLNVIENSIREMGEMTLELKKTLDDDVFDIPKKERNLRTPLRTSRRSNTPTTLQTELKLNPKSNKILQPPVSQLAMDNNNKKEAGATKHETTSIGAEIVLNHFLESNSSSICAENTTETQTISKEIPATMAATSNSGCIAMATQIDLTMSSSSSNSNCSTTNTTTTVEAATLSRIGGSTNGSGGGVVNILAVGGGGSSNNSMLPPTTILSSSDPLPDVIFRPNDFSSIIATQQLRGGTLAPNAATVSQSFNLSMEEEAPENASGADNSEEDSASSSLLSNATGRNGRGRGRGSRGGKAATGRAYRAHRLGRSASAVAKAIAVNRPKWVGALKHTPDPERIKGLYNPAPQVFEEDTRMSADLTQLPSMPQDAPPTTPTKQPDFLNAEESQSSVISTSSMLDPNNVLALQNGSATKKPARKKKMEVCVSEDADFTVASIAEYEWPRPKGCCPSKNRDTFMIQEQVANYLGIKSFKRKYPDLPRRQVDMEERNWLQEQGLVSEKMCDLGITAVWASDILDIMYSDFYEKYEEYKTFVRQKHLREIETKQKALGLNVAGRGLQARDRAMLNASKWNSYFNKTRKEERLSCLDLQTLVINKPSPVSAPISTIPYRPVADAVALAAKLENVPLPPTLLPPRVCEAMKSRDVYYPLSLVPGQFCEKYFDYSPEELRRFPLNTVLSHNEHLWQQQDNVESNSSDTDSAVESIENDEENELSIATGPKILRKRRTRRMRTGKLSTSKDEFKIPPLPGASVSATSSNDSSSSSDDETASDTDSESSTSSAASSDETSEDENSPATCGVCLHPHNRNLKNLPELFIQCYTCKRKVHPSCIEMPHRMSTRVRNYNWQCADCKCCIKCKRRQEQNKMLFCEQCDRGFHIYCLGVKSVPDGRWSCDRCSICIRCGATKPEGLPMAAQQINNKSTRQKKLKWVNEYRIDHITKLKEHSSMLCVPCGRARTTKRVQIPTQNNTCLTYSGGAVSPNCSSAQCLPNQSLANATSVATTTSSSNTSLSNDLTSGTVTTEAININNDAIEETMLNQISVVGGTSNLDNIVASGPYSNSSSSSKTSSINISTTAQQSAVAAVPAAASIVTGGSGGGGLPPVVA